MSLLSWNCQGLGVTLIVRALKDIIRRYKPSLIFLMETRMEKKKLQKIQRSLPRFSNGWFVDPIDTSGGKRILSWKSSIRPKMISIRLLRVA